MAVSTGLRNKLIAAAGVCVFVERVKCAVPVKDRNGLVIGSEAQKERYDEVSLKNGCGYNRALSYVVR